MEAYKVTIEIGLTFAPLATYTVRVSEFSALDAKVSGLFYSQYPPYVDYQILTVERTNP